MKTSTLHSCTVKNSTCTCFYTLTEEQLDLIEQNKVEVNYRKGEIICKQGTFAPHVVFLQEGLAKVYLEGENENLVLKIMPAGNLISLSSVLTDNNLFHYSALAYEDSKACLININTFRELIHINNEFAAAIIDIMCENSMQTFGRFYCLTHKQLYGRLADILLCLADRIFKNNDFELNLSRKEMAELSGMSTESVIRMLKKFKDDGIIDMEGKQLSIKNYEQLRQISEYG